MTGRGLKKDPRICLYQRGWSSVFIHYSQETRPQELTVYVLLLKRRLTLISHL